MEHILQIISINPTFLFVLAVLIMLSFVTWLVSGPICNLKPYEEHKPSVEIKDITYKDAGKYFRILEEGALEFCIIQIGEKPLADGSDHIIDESYWVHRIEQLKDFHKNDVFTVRVREHHTKIILHRGIHPYKRGIHPYNHHELKQKSILN